MILPLPGDRIRLDLMPDDPDPIPPGSTGTVTQISNLRWPEMHHQIWVKWDAPIRRSLSLICPPDTFTILETADGYDDEGWE